MRLRPWRVLAGVLILAAAGYLAVCANLYLTQDSQVFPAPAYDPARFEVLAKTSPGLARLHLTAPDATLLSGLYLPRTIDEKPAPLLLYFGGNKDICLDFFADAPRQLPDQSLACFDYRGYGESRGKPTEEALKADALTAYDRLAERTKAPSLTAMGRSMGCALAAHVAANRQASGLILVTPADSIAAVGQERYPYIPVSLLLRSPFDATADAAKAVCPALVFIAASDATVPPRHGLRLAAFLGGQKKIVELAGDHSTILKNPGYWPEIREFLTKK